MANKGVQRSAKSGRPLMPGVRCQAGREKMTRGKKAGMAFILVTVFIDVLGIGIIIIVGSLFIIRSTPPVFSE